MFPSLGEKTPNRKVGKLTSRRREQLSNFVTDMTCSVPRSRTFLKQFDSTSHQIHRQWILSHIDLEGNEIADTLDKAGACEVPELSAPLTFLEIFSRTKHQNKTTWITAPLQSTIGISVLVLEAHAGHACSHPRVSRAHQAGLSRRFLAGVGLSESVQCHGPGLALLTNGGACNNNNNIACRVRE
ncbi:RNase H domain-containing protein [Trichonephila clavipes]|nr:RNase H domain-containing protein [Trichonephila clavipes]